MAGFKRQHAMRRLQENYAKLPPEKQRGMGYGTITKIPKASGANASAAPKAVSKPKPMRSEASESDLSQMKITAEARALPEGDLTYGKERGLAGLRKRLRK